jgi:hypothetical protein
MSASHQSRLEQFAAASTSDTRHEALKTTENVASGSVTIGDDQYFMPSQSRAKAKR